MEISIVILFPYTDRAPLAVPLPSARAIAKASGPCSAIFLVCAHIWCIFRVLYINFHSFSFWFSFSGCVASCNVLCCRRCCFCCTVERLCHRIGPTSALHWLLLSAHTQAQQLRLQLQLQQRPKKSESEIRIWLASLFALRSQFKQQSTVAFAVRCSLFVMRQWVL